ncbi:MAG: hypothetical protein WBD07_18315 [Vicinamibacterales bacterium]
MNHAKIWESFDRIKAAVDPDGELSSAEKLAAIESAWLYWSVRARDDELSIPGGFPVEQARQVACLEKLLAGVRAAEPDLELERLTLEGDREGIIRHMMKKIGPEGWNGPST